MLTETPNNAMVPTACKAAPCPPQHIAVPLAAAKDERMARSRITLGLLMISISACGDPGLENVPPGWEQAKVITLHHTDCGVDYESKMGVSHKTAGSQVRIQIKKLSMRCLPIPNPGLSAAIRSQTSHHHEILIHPVEPLGPYESCNCRSDVEAVFELGAGNHQIDIYTWTMWGENPWKTTSVNVSL
jgi:hypothetical protein